MKQEFFVPGPLPNLNEIIGAAKGYNGRGFAYSKMKREWTALVVEAIEKANLNPVLSCEVVFIWHEKNKRRDPDNFSVGKKFILDGLVKAGILENDGWDNITRLTDVWMVNKDRPGVWVEITS